MPGECGCVNDADADHAMLEPLRQTPPADCKRPAEPRRRDKPAPASPAPQRSQEPESRKDGGKDDSAPSLPVAGKQEPSA